MTARASQTRIAAPRLHLFGAAVLATGAVRDPFPAERPYQVLAYLACRRVWVARDAAAALFWPERDPSTARANLRFVLVQIRRHRHFEGFEARGDALRWVVDTDVQRFEAAAAAGDWATAIGNYGMPLFDGGERDAPSPFRDWLAFERTRLEALWHNVLAQRLAQLGNDPAAANALAARALHYDPLDETALTHQLRSLAVLGRVDEARRAYREYAQRLASELAIEPSAAVRDLARGYDSNRPTAAAPTKHATDAAGLIGRRLELVRLHELLNRDDCRALTVTGTGGVGKSTLARAALAAFADEFADGAFWIALDDLRTVDQVTARCAGVLGIELRVGTPPLEQLRERLDVLRALLVLDNAEHLEGLAAWVAGLLGSCSRVTILLTSRVRLGFAGEWLVPLGGLPSPDADETEVEVLRAFDAVRLFETRARRANPDFDLRSNVVDIAALVRAVEGLPLAIELAAAWVRLLPVAEIRRELEQSLDLLDGPVAGSGRGIGVRDSFQHSWRLLTPAEQHALARLAVFHGDFSRESARAVADAALPLLAGLADKSLLRMAEGGRFALHPLVGQFALERLAEQGADEQHAAAARHAEHFLARLARYNDFHTLDQRGALQAIGTEIVNTLVAWRWAVAQRRVDLLQHCASALESYLDARGEQQLGLELLSDAAAVIDDALPAHQLARCHVQLGRAAFCFRRGDFSVGESAARAALQAAQRIKYRFGVKSSTNTLGVMLWRLGRTKEAAFCLRDVVRRAYADGDQAGIPLYELNLGRLEIELGNHNEGERLLREALAGCRRNGNDVGIQASLNELSNLQLESGHPEAALRLAHEGLALCESSGIRRNESYFHRDLADAYFDLNEFGSSAKHARAALEAIGSGGDRNLEPACRVRLAGIALHSGDNAGALVDLRAAARLAVAMRSPRVQAAVVATYAEARLRAGDPERARTLYALVAGHAATPRRWRELAVAGLAALPPASANAGEREAPNLEAALERLLTEP